MYLFGLAKLEKTDRDDQLAKQIYIFDPMIKKKENIPKFQLHPLHKPFYTGDLEIYTKMAIIYQNEETIFLTGGISGDELKVSNKFQIYNPKDGKVMKNIPPMF